MPTRSAFEYAVIRVVPRVERGEFINVGVVLFCRTRRFLRAQAELDLGRIVAFAPRLDVVSIQEQLNFFPVICEGGARGGPIGQLPQAERFRWLVAPRSTIIQPSPVHCGLCEDPQTTLETLINTLVRQMSG